MILAVLMGDTQIIFAILILSLMLSGIAFMTGYIIGQTNESTKIKRYCRENQMNVTGELYRDLYPIDFSMEFYQEAKEVAT